MDARSARAGWAPEQIGSRIAARFGAGAVSDVSHGTVTADIAPQRWLESLTFARDELDLPSAAKVFGGADVHERETAKQFGIRFAGHPDPPPLPLSADPGVPPPR